MQQKPRFNGILAVAALMVLVLFFVSMSPLLSVSAAKHLNYSEIYYYFQSNQVTSFRLDRNNLRLELWLKEGERPLPEATTELDSEEASGLLSALGPGEEDAPRFSRTVSFSRDDFANKVNQKVKGAGLEADDLENQVLIKSRFASGRVESVQVGAKTVTGKTLRTALSLDSANFTIHISKDGVTVTTKGYGHGVGMSQLGANAMAAKGADYGELLRHYYTGVEIVDLEDFIK